MENEVLMESMSQEEGFDRLAEAAERYARYPQGSPFPVTVTLTDEQWNAVRYALEGMLIANNTEGSEIAPNYINNQWVESIRVIREEAQAQLGPRVEAQISLATDELLDDIAKELKHD